MLTPAITDHYSAALAAMPDRLRNALSEKTNVLAATLQAKIQENLSGGVLNTKSGALLRSIVTMVEDAADKVTVTLAASGDIKYAAIHEFGGLIPPHEIVPDKAKALAFLVGGKQVFAAHVNIPAIVMPERSYMRAPLAAMSDEIVEDLSAVVLEMMP